VVVQDSSVEEMFQVNSVTGEITLLGQLDYEGMQQQYRLTITAMVCTV